MKANGRRLQNEYYVQEAKSKRIGRKSKYEIQKILESSSHLNKVHYLCFMLEVAAHNEGGGCSDQLESMPG